MAAGLGADLGVAAAAFVGTNIDNAVVTMALVAGAPEERARRIALGQVRTDNQIRVAFIIANIGTFGNLRHQEKIF